MQNDNVDEEVTREFLWTPQDLTRYLKLKKPQTIRRLIHEGKITEADGWIKIGRLNRFIKRVVIARCEAGLFARGLDQDGNLAQPRGRMLRIVA